MDTGTWISVLLSALIGAIAAILTGVPLEHYRRHRDRQGSAAVLAAEIAALLHVFSRNDASKKFEALLPILDSGKDVQLPTMYTVNPEFGPIFEKNIDKLGLLPVDVADRIVRFYSYLVGIRALIKNLIDSSWKDLDPAIIVKIKAAWIRSGIALWKDAETLAKPLVDDLRKIAAEPWGFGRCLQSCRRFFIVSDKKGV